VVCIRRESKAQTSRLSIEGMPVPDELELILGQHIGAPCTPTVVKRGEVGEGDIIGEVTKGLGVPLHSPVAGKVKDLGSSAHPMRVTAPSITITVNHEAAPRQYQARNWQSYEPKELLNMVKDAGIIGIGGAGFPTHVKLSPPSDNPIDTLLLNGAECEPYITSDHRQMLEYAADIVEGAKIILKILGIRQCLIGIESNKPDAIQVMTEAARAGSTAESRWPSRPCAGQVSPGIGEAAHPGRHRSQGSGHGPALGGRCGGPERLDRPGDP